MMQYTNKLKWAWFLGFLLTIPMANYLIQNWGTTCIPNGPCLIPVGFNLMAPSGVLMIGLALVLRDQVHEHLGKNYALLAIFGGCALSLFVAPPALAVASTVAFGFSELSNHYVYSWIREKSRSIAVLVSGTVGAFLDSLLFVYIAFGAVDFALGTTLGKIYASVAVSLFFYWRMKVATLPRDTNN